MASISFEMCLLTALTFAATWSAMFAAQTTINPASPSPSTFPGWLEILVVHPTLHMTRDRTNRRARAATNCQPTDKPDRRKDRARGASREPPTNPMRRTASREPPTNPMRRTAAGT
jgi:hypothetical protein